MVSMAPVQTLFSPRGMVATVDHLASSAGLDMLRRGGSVADAAVAASAVLAVTTQHMCGMGGDLLTVVQQGAGDGPATTLCLDASGRSGSGADAASLRALGHTVMPAFGDANAVTVPGCVDGWLALHARLGRLDLAEVLAPARCYAADGFPCSPSLAAALAALGPVEGAGDYFASGLPEPGQLVRRPGVARALDAIISDGHDGFYLGDLGQDLLRLAPGLIVAEDLAEHQAEWRQPIGVDAWGSRIWSMPPASQGYLLASAAWMASRLPLPADPSSPAWAHLLVEASKQAAFDRDSVLYDGADGAELVSPERLEPRLDRIDAARVLPVRAPAAGGGTVALCVADAAGNGVSMLQSNATGFGSRLVARSVGVFLHNRGIGFALAQGHPAEYGPRRRPPHTLSPALVTSEGMLIAVAATMGGDSQPQVLLQVLARLLQAGQPPAEALAAGRFVLAAGATSGRLGGAGAALARNRPAGFDTWGDAALVVRVEDHAPTGWVEGLARLGHDAARAEPRAPGFGHAQLIARDAATGLLTGSFDHRAGSGGACGW
ncbi:MAG: gamma-glutamyltransferase family protein [Acidimicrobiales bacterium]